MKILIFALAFCFLYTSYAQPQNGKVIQFDISGVLNARPVTVLTNNKLVTWTKGIDGDGKADGYLTQSAADFNGDKNAHALPDGPLYPATSFHPEIKLHYSNADSAHYQACSITGEGKVAFAVPKGKYRDIYLALTSAEGASALQISFTYTNGVETKNFTLPDYYADIAPADTSLSYLAHDLAKWGNKNNMTEKDHHNIDLLRVRPDPSRTLKNISISKTKPGYLVFWAAAGVVVK